MKVPYAEDLANHSSPESCGGCGNGLAEALTGGSAGELLSSEITTSRVRSEVRKSGDRLENDVGEEKRGQARKGEEKRGQARKRCMTKELSPQAPKSKRKEEKKVRKKVCA